MFVLFNLNADTVVASVCIYVHFAETNIHTHARTQSITCVSTRKRRFFTGDSKYAGFSMCTKALFQPCTRAQLFAIACTYTTPRYTLFCACGHHRIEFTQTCTYTHQKPTPRRPHAAAVVDTASPQLGHRHATSRAPLGHTHLQRKRVRASFKFIELDTHTRTNAHTHTHAHKLAAQHTIQRGTIIILQTLCYTPGSMVGACECVCLCEHMHITRRGQHICSVCKLCSHMIFGRSGTVIQPQTQAYRE